MKRLFVFLSIFLVSCNQPDECPEVIFDPTDKITTTMDEVLYTGRCMTYNEYGKKSVQQYLNGKDYGKWVFYFPDGQIQTKGRFNEFGKRVGKWRYYHENGKIKQISIYSKDGDRIGKWIEYNDAGDIINEINH